MSKVGYGICFLLLCFLLMHYGLFVGVLLDSVLIILILFYLRAVQIVDDGTEASIAADNSLYIAVMFEVAGQVCAAKGHVSDEDRSRVYDMIKKMQLDAETEVLSRYAFNMGQTKNYPLRTRLKQLYRAYSDDKRGLMLFCKNMLELALIDGRLHNNERRILNIIADEFRIPYAQMLIFASQTIHKENEYRHYWQTNEQWKQQRQHARSEQRRQQYQQQQKQYQQQQRHNQQQQPEEPFGTDPYLVLGISAKSNPQEIKQAYRRLMNKYHPDKLIKQNLSETEMQRATEHAQRIQAAYAYVKQLRGFV
ncbi:MULTISPECIES: co-chaperone DjlA [unclassified Snodgrassella]|uniref:co-chaperone DjlA n=1 Tax=unclassified Snodgrassella TaxID=2625236 RepID=UPI0018DB1066|nr:MULTISPECIES: co-chaperone DjlA [unclassified Snodgrassella]MBI0067890.1 co-chaperone DjlA [Snodgrassella sp. M0110]MBI0076889.1 co-chaperone DjlA [Snodgrassella sp. M0118]MBI0079190.1 co-chaperone DjlA [Snodgrassella sp. M0112]